MDLLTCGILNNLSKLATCIDVTDEGAPTTPDITLWSISGLLPSLHLYSPSSILLMDPIIYNYLNIPIYDLHNGNNKISNIHPELRQISCKIILCGDLTKEKMKLKLN